MFIELEFDVGYDYDPGEPMVLYPNEFAHPGSDPYVTVTSVMKGTVELIDMLSDSEIESIEQRVWDEIEQNDDRGNEP